MLHDTSASNGFLVELVDAATQVHREDIPTLVYKASTMGISGHVEPILCFPLNPVILVEGPLDRRVLTYVSQTTGVAARCVFLPVTELDPIQRGAGADNLIDYLKRTGRFIHNRPVTAPLIVLFDWDVPDDKLRRARQYYGANADIRVFPMNQAHADAKISRMIRGIERFYPVELFHAATDRDIVDVACDKHGNISVEKDKLTEAKYALAELLCQAPDGAWCGHLRKVLEDVERAAALLPGQQIGGLI